MKKSPEITKQLLTLLPPEGRIADIGCGDGGFLAALPGEKYERVGVDPSFEKDRWKAGGGIWFLRGSAEDLPLADGWADAVILQCVFSLCRPEEAVREICRVLKPGGVLILSDLFSDALTGSKEGQSSPAGLSGQLYTRKQLEGFFSGFFERDHFSDETEALKDLAVRAIMEEDACISREEMRRLRGAKARYGLWAFRKDPQEAREVLAGRQIAYARQHSPFYSYLPEEPVTSSEDLQRIPVISVRDLVDHGTDMLCCDPSEVQRIVTLSTSGTTGDPKRICFTRGDLERTVEFFRDGMSRLCSEGEKTAIFLPGTAPDGVCDLLERGLRSCGAVPVSCGPILDYGDAAAFCRRERPRVLVGLPVQMRALAVLFPDLKPERVLISADFCAESLIRTIERVWGCEVYVHYGMTESGYGCAVETPERDGMHLRRDVLLEQLPDGELVLTTLRREAMPLIRYRTGDIGELLPDGKVLKILGRKEELQKPVSIMQLDELLFSRDEILDYTAVLRGKVLELYLEEKGQRPAEAEKGMRSLEEELGDILRGLEIRVSPAENCPVERDVRRKRSVRVIDGQ